MELSVMQEELEVLKRRNLRLIFVIGRPGAGKGLQCRKAVNEFKYVHISTGDLMRNEIQNGTKLGIECHQYSSKGYLVPNEIVVSLLIKTLINTQGQTFLIDGFPRNIDQALYIEKNLSPIKVIFSFSCNEEIARQRISSRKQDQDDEDNSVVLTKLEEFQHSRSVIQFYKKFGVVREVDTERGVNDVYQSFKESLLPEVYCIMGKRYSGKSTFSQRLQKQFNFHYLNFKEIVNDPKLKMRVHEDEIVVAHLLGLLRSFDVERVIIEDFPLKEEYYKLFVKNGKPIKKIFYLECEDYLCTERMMSLGKTSPNFIGCSNLHQEIKSFNDKNPKKFLNANEVLNVDVNNYLDLSYGSFVDTIKPSILMFGGQNTELKEKLIQSYVDSKGYIIIDVKHIITI